MQRVSLARPSVWAAVLCAMFPTAGATRADSAPDLLLEVAGLDVAVWQPTDGPSPYPLVLFSHGIGGCKTQSTYLMRALAEHGMLVAAPDHKDVGEHCPDELPNLEEVASKFIGPHQDRIEDLNKLRDALPDDPTLSQWPTDPDRVALIGHSLGGYTVLGLAAAGPSGQIQGTAAVVALAPYVLPLLADSAVESIAVPVLLQSGAEDFLTPAKNQDDVFAELTAPVCKVTYAGADHFAWTDFQTEFHDATAAAIIVFLDEVFAGRRPTGAILASSQTDQGEECK